MDRSTKAERTAIALSLGLAIWYVLVAIDSVGIPEMGDGVQHHLIVKWAQLHPVLLLDHWGKPLFTLLALPFAQFGIDGMAVFNALLAALTAWAAIRALRPAGGFAQLSFPLLVLLAPLYRLMVVAGMTEVLFGLLTVTTVLLLLNDRPVLAAIVASFTPLSRPEFIVFVPLIILWLAMQRRWGSLPFLATGLFIYSAIAWIAIGDPLWYWNRDPYPVKALYGSGNPWHFMDSMNTITGRPLAMLCAAALLLWAWVWRSDKAHRRQHMLLMLCAAVPAVLALVLHSLLWGMGLKGSAGLTRVLVTVVPLAGLFTTFTLARAGAIWMTERTLRMDLSWLIFIGVVIWSWADLQLNRLFPVRPSPDQIILDQAGDRMRGTLGSNARVYSTHPYMALRSGADPFDTTRYQGLWGTWGFDHRFRPGDLIFWDAQLGPNEAGVPLAALLDDPHFTVLGVWTPSDGHTVLGGHPYEIFLFERRDAQRSVTTDTLIGAWNAVADLRVRFDTVPCTSGRRTRCFVEGEFPLEITGLSPPGEEVLYDELRLTAEVEFGGDHHMEVVYNEHIGDQHLHYDARRLKSGILDLRFRIPPVDPRAEQVIYIYNVSKRPFRIKDLRLVRERWIQRSSEVPVSR